MYHITFKPIDARQTGDNYLAPGVYQIHVGEERVGAVLLRLTGTQKALLPLRAGLKDDADGLAYLDNALLRFGLRLIERELASGTIDLQSDGNIERELQPEEEEELVRVIRSKSCSYQRADGRDLFCAAAANDDSTVVGREGLRALAPTSRPICSACELPDAHFICSHLLHPSVRALQTFGHYDYKRELVSATCDRGRPEMDHPFACHAGGHECWERLFEPPAEERTAALSALALPEAFEFLDVAWELEFKVPLLRKGSLVGAAQLALPCASRSEFESRMSALAGVLKAVDVPDSLLPDKHGLAGDQTLMRVKASLQKRFAGKDVSRADAAVSTLQSMATVRAALQHSDAIKKLPKALASLGLRSLGSPSEDWDAVRAKAVEAIATLREEVRVLGGKS